MNRIKAIIFDYDGIISESVNIKTEAFAEMFRPFGQDVEKMVINHHESNGGVSRFEKFKLYYRDFLKKDITPHKIDSLSIKFSNLVLDRVVDAPYVQGAYEFLSSNYKKYDFYISTGTPTEEIEIILEQKGIKKFFKGVYGSPENKAVHVKRIMQLRNYKNDEIIFIGDALSDKNAATINKIDFIGRFTTDESIKHSKYLIKDFNQINKTLNKIEKR